MLASAAGSRIGLAHTQPSVGYALTRLFRLLMRCVFLTRVEVVELMAELLMSDSVSVGTSKLAGWLTDNWGILGPRYVSVPRRNFGR